MLEDQEYIDRIKSGDRRAFEMLIRQYQNLVNHIVYKMVGDVFEREEICQDVFIKVYRNINHFRGDSKLSTWIGKIAWNMSADYLKKRKLPLSGIYANSHDKDDLNKQLEQALVEPEKADEGVRIREINTLIHSNINRLPANYRTVIMLYHIEERSYEEIGKIMDMPDGTVKSYLFRARKILKENLMKNYSREEIWL